MNARDFTRLVRYEVLANRTYSKLFGIGFNKTGSTTMEAVFRLYGFAVPNQKEQEAAIVKQLRQGNYEPLKEFVSRHDAFQDLPFSQGDCYVLCDALFPNSKFILTERDPEEWFSSLYRYRQKTHQVERPEFMTEADILAKEYLYIGYRHMSEETFLTTSQGGEVRVRWDKLFDRDFYIEKYMNRNAEIKHYFQNRPDALLVIDVTKERDTSEICRFLGIPERYVIEIPHINKT